MRVYRVAGVDGQVLTVQLDDETAARVGAVPVDAPVEEHATAPVAAVEAAVPYRKRSRR